MLQHWVIHADATTVQIPKPKAERNSKTHRAYLWAYSPRRHEDVKAVVYDFCESRAGKHGDEFLEDWSCTLLVDDFAGYKQVMGGTIKDGGMLGAHQAEVL